MEHNWSDTTLIPANGENETNMLAYIKSDPLCPLDDAASPTYNTSYVTGNMDGNPTCEADNDGDTSRHKMP